MFVFGWSFISLLHPLLQCFIKQRRSIRTCPTGIRVLCQVWIVVSELSLSLVSGPRRLFRCCVLLNIRISQLEFFTGPQFSHVLLFCFVCWKRNLFVVVCGGLVFLFFVAPSLAVFSYAYVFNQDVSNWNTGAVTTMSYSKCSHSLSHLCCVFEYLYM